MSDEHATFWDIISDIQICMVTTVDGQVIRARPMAAFIDTDDRLIQFVTDKDSPKIEEMLSDRDVCLAFADPKGLKFASVSGRAQICDDRSRINRLWGPYCDVFFPDGPESVNVVTLNATQGEYWDNSNGMLNMAVEVTRAYFGDDGPDLGENAKVAL